jgi:hypothetical protein
MIVPDGGITPITAGHDRLLEPHRLIDWGSGVYGPLLYDLASAVMYVGGLSALATGRAASVDHRAGSTVDRSGRDGAEPS